MGYTNAQRDEIRAKFYEKACGKFAKLDLTAENIEALYMQCFEVIKNVTVLYEYNLRAAMTCDLKALREAAYARQEKRHRDETFENALTIIKNF